MLFGFAMGLWIGVGSQLQRPPAVLAPRSVAGCTNSTLGLNATTTAPPPEYDGLPLYRLSFLWYSTVCFGITFIVGLLFSVLLPGEIFQLIEVLCMAAKFLSARLALA